MRHEIQICRHEVMPFGILWEQKHCMGNMILQYPLQQQKFLIACNPSTIEQEISNVRQLNAEIFQTDGADAFVNAMFAKDGVVMSPQKPTYTGPIALREFAASIPKQMIPFFANRAQNYVCLSDDYAVGYGLFASDNPVVRLLNIWRREVAGWKLYMNIDTGDTGPPQ